MHVLPKLSKNWNFQNVTLFLTVFRGIVKRDEPYVILVSFQGYSDKWITLSLKEWRLWHLILTSHFPPKFFITSVCRAIPVMAAYFHKKNLWCRMFRSQQETSSSGKILSENKNWFCQSNLDEQRKSYINL